MKRADLSLTLTYPDNVSLETLCNYVSDALEGRDVLPFDQLYNKLRVSNIQPKLVEGRSKWALTKLALGESRVFRDLTMVDRSRLRSAIQSAKKLHGYRYDRTVKGNETTITRVRPEDKPFPRLWAFGAMVVGETAKFVIGDRNVANICMSNVNRIKREKGWDFTVAKDGPNWTIKRVS